MEMRAAVASIGPQAGDRLAHAARRWRVTEVVAGWWATPYTDLFSLVIVLHVLIWWIVALVLFAPSDIHNDMAEAFAWGLDPQWGYYKHPPLWAWIARGWFAVFPAVDWAFHLLSVVNSAVGLIGVWAIAGRYVSGPTRLAAILLLELVPFNNILAFTFNANAIQLSIWPWAVYAFIVSFETRRPLAAIGFGILAAAAMMSKYFGGVMLASCAVAALTNQRARPYFRGAAPYISAVVFCACLAPHAAWLVRTSGGPVHYLLTKTDYPYLLIVEKVLTVGLGAAVLHGLLAAVLLIWWVRRREPAWALKPRALGMLLARPRMRLVLVLAVAPLVLTILASLVGHVRISTKFTAPLFFLVPLTWLIWSGARLQPPALSTLLTLLGVTAAAFLLLAFPTAFLKFKTNDRHFAEPRAQVARRVTGLWHAYMGTPLRIVAGTEAYALAATFYGSDHPSYFINFSFADAPWIDHARLRREGLAVICSTRDQDCLRNMERLGAGQGARFTMADMSKSFFWGRGESVSFEILMIRPRYAAGADQPGR